MASRGSRSGFSLVEALFASAVLVSVLVPALLAFHGHIAALMRQRQTLGVELTLENLYSETERRLLLGPANDEPAGAVSLAGPVKTVISPPTATPCGATRLLRYEIFAEDPAASIRRDGLLYGLPPTREYTP